MMEAGVSEYGLFDDADRAEWVVWAVFQAMVKEALRSGHIKKIAATWGTADNPVIGVAPPPGCEWLILGKWPET